MDPVRLHRREFLQRACAFRVVYSARDWRALRGPSRIGPQGSPTSRKFASCHSPIRRFNALFPALSLSRGGLRSPGPRPQPRHDVLQPFRDAARLYPNLAVHWAADAESLLRRAEGCICCLSRTPSILAGCLSVSANVRGELAIAVISVWRSRRRVRNREMPSVETGQQALATMASCSACGSASVEPSSNTGGWGSWTRWL